MDSILVAVDGSDGARHAARFASKLAAETGAKIILTHVYDVPSVTMLGLAHTTAEQVQAAKASMARASFEAARLQFSDAVEVEELPEMGHPAHTIVATAADRQVDLVVMGSRGHSLIKDLLMGSVSEYVVRHAACPVTVVR